MSSQRDDRIAASSGAPRETKRTMTRLRFEIPSKVILGTPPARFRRPSLFRPFRGLPREQSIRARLGVGRWRSCRARERDACDSFVVGSRRVGGCAMSQLGVDAIVRELAKVGIALKREWVSACVAHLERSDARFATMPLNHRETSQTLPGGQAESSKLPL